MVYTKRNLSKIKLNNTRKLRGGTKPAQFADTSTQVQISAAVAATIRETNNNYSSPDQQMVKAKLKHLIKKQMLNTLDKIKTNADKSDTKYPILKHYNDYENKVKQFFIEYRIFDKLADIFFSMQGNMHQLFPSHKLMLPIRIELSEGDKKQIKLGSNFICFYDYLSGKEYLYVSSNQLKNGINTTFIRREFDDTYSLPIKGGGKGKGKGKVKFSEVEMTELNDNAKAEAAEEEEASEEEAGAARAAAETARAQGMAHQADPQPKMKPGSYKSHFTVPVETVKFLPPVTKRSPGAPGAPGSPGAPDGDYKILKLTISPNKALGFGIQKTGRTRWTSSISVSRIDADSPVINKLQLNDVIKSFTINDDIEITTYNEMLPNLLGKDYDRTFIIKYKEGKAKSDSDRIVTITIERQLKNFDKNQFGVNFDSNALPPGEGLKIAEIYPGGIAEELELRKDEIVTAINNNPIMDSVDFGRQYQQAVNKQEPEDITISIIHKKKESGLLKLFKPKIDTVTVNISNSKKFSPITIKEGSNEDIFSQNVDKLLNKPFYKHEIYKAIEKFKTQYLDDYQSLADDEDKKMKEQLQKEKAQAEENAKAAAEEERKSQETQLNDTRVTDQFQTEAELKESQKEATDLKGENISLKAKQGKLEKELEEAKEEAKKNASKEGTKQKAPEEEKKQKGGVLNMAAKTGIDAARKRTFYTQYSDKDDKNSNAMEIGDDDQFSEDDMLVFIEFVYYSTYAFYHVFSTTLKVRETQMKMFFKNYIDELMNMLQKNFSTIINNSSIYISIARALAITFEKKLGAAFNTKTLEQKNMNLRAIDQNKVSTLNESGQIESELKKDRLFSTDSFFNLKNKQIRSFIFKTYNDIKDLQTAMDDASLDNRQYKVASRLDYRFTVEILGKTPMKQGMIENAQVRQALANIFSGNFGMFRNILEDIDKSIDEFDGTNIEDLHTKLQMRLPKLASFGPEGMVFQFDERLLEMGSAQTDLLSQQVIQKRQELAKLMDKQTKVKKLGKKPTSPATSAASAPV